MLRQSFYKQAEEVIADEALLLPLVHEQVYRFGHPRLEGFEVMLSKPIASYHKLRVRD